MKAPQDCIGNSLFSQCGVCWQSGGLSLYVGFVLGPQRLLGRNLTAGAREPEISLQTGVVV